MHKFRIIIGFFLLLNSASANESALSNAEKFIDSLQTIDQFVTKALEAFHVPGAAIGIVIGNEIIFKRGYGICNAISKRPVTEHTLFNIASCTKAFTSLLLGQLVEEGKISWNDPVIKYLPEFRLFNETLTSQVTIRDLAAHRTGIDRHDAIWIGFKPSRTDILKCLPYLEPSCLLREEFHYNNLMYAIIGLLIERVTGQTWEETLSFRIFAPLQMASSYPSFNPSLSKHDFSFPHALIEGRVKTIPFYDDLSIRPGGGICSNVHDMTKWLIFQLSDGKSLNKDSLQESHTIQMPNLNSENEDEVIHQMGYGLGWFIGTYRGDDYISHGGNYDGFSSEVFMLPQKKFGIVILTNIGFTSSGNIGSYFINALRNNLLDNFLQKEDCDWIKRIRETNSKRLKDKAGSGQPSAPSSRLLTDYEGYYENPAYGLVRISMEKDHLLAHFGEDQFPLNHKYLDIFDGGPERVLDYGFKIDFSFIENSSGDICELHLPFEAFRGAKPIIFQRKN